MKLEFVSRLENEAFARTSAVAFLMPLNLDMEAIMEIKTMLAEAIVNAMIHGYESRESGTIVLQISYDEEFIHMTVQDEGCGIAESELKNIFKRFYRINKEVNPNSVGIGLSLTKSIVEGMGGKISVRRELGCYTQFILTFVHT